MAKPQAEDGHIDIANEIAERLAKTQLSGYEQRVLWALWRKTWGWHKKEDAISLSQFMDITEIPTSHIARTLKRLINRNIIYKRNGKISIYGFQKDYEQWNITNLDTTKKGTTRNDKLPKLALPKKVSTTTKIGKKQLPKLVDTKEIKETIQKKKSEIPKSDLTKLLKNLILQNNPKAKITESQLRKWDQEVQRMRFVDDRSYKEIEALIQFSQNDPFWRTNILSMGKLRKQFDQLTLKQQSEKPPPEKPIKLYTPEPSPTKEQIENNQKRVKELIKSL